MIDVEIKIESVLNNDYDVPYTFKEILKKDIYLLADEQIVDLIWLEREYLQQANKSHIYSAAKLLVLTSYGLVIAEEGFTKISDDMMGYKILHIPFNKITDIELDVCLLDGVLKIATNGYGKNESGIKFNTAKYYPQFVKFIEALRQKIITA